MEPKMAWGRSTEINSRSLTVQWAEHRGTKPEEGYDQEWNSPVRNHRQQHVIMCTGE